MAREDPFGGRDMWFDSLLLFRLSSSKVFDLFGWVRRASSFSKSEFEIGICYEIGILPEHSETNNYF